MECWLTAMTSGLVSSGGRPIVHLGQVCTEHQGRAEDRPKGHHGPLFRMRQPGFADLSPSRDRAEVSEGQHVCVGPMTGLDQRRPLAREYDLTLKALREVFCRVFLLPVVPEVVGDAPHLRVLAQLVDLVEGRGTGREAQHDGTARLSQRFAHHADLIGLEGNGDAIDLKEIEAPARVQFGNGIVIGLRSCIGLQAVVVRIPAAGVGGIGRIRRMEVAAARWAGSFRPPLWGCRE